MDGVNTDCSLGVISVSLKQSESGITFNKLRLQLDIPQSDAPNQRFHNTVSVMVAGFDLSFCDAVVKIYSFATLRWVNKNGNM